MEKQKTLRQIQAEYNFFECFQLYVEEARD